ncbi:glycoside hydrolase [Xylaria sp. FL0064]|nr:glycoside hydrolase [Xylaria sp. FL0064]
MKGLFTKAVPLLLALGSQAATYQRNTDKPITDPKRVVQYYGSQTNDDGTKFHIDLLVNNPDNKTYATNVLMGEFDLKPNTMRLNGGDPDAPANDWFWDEIKTVQDAGVKVSLWLRQGYSLLKNNNSTFDTHYAIVNKTITDHGFDGIDLDIEDGENGCTEDSMNLADTLHLVKRLRADFGPDFIITLAPVSNALLEEGSVCCFSYKDLERHAGPDINWYNAQFYGGSWTGLKTPAWVGLNETGPTIETLVDKYADFGGVGGFDYYDAQPGGYPNPWQWSRWAARRMGV